MITNAALSELDGLSPGPCLQRVKRMEESGLIAGYQAEIDVHRLADTITIFTEITIADHRREDFTTSGNCWILLPNVAKSSRR